MGRISRFVAAVKGNFSSSFQTEKLFSLSALIDEEKKKENVGKGKNGEKRKRRSHKKMKWKLRPVKPYKSNHYHEEVFDLPISFVLI